MNYRYILFLIIGIDVVVLLLQTSQLSISYLETEILSGGVSFLKLLVDGSIYLFGKNDFALRFPMIAMHISSVFLMFNISKKYLRHKRDRLWLISIFILLPGVISSALIVNEAGVIIFGLLLFIYLFDKIPKIYIYFIIYSYTFISKGFFYLFISLIFYGYFKKDFKMIFVSAISMCLSIYMFGDHIAGIPKNYFVDTLGLYGAVFTPIIFIYIFYTLYREWLSRRIELIWFISAIPLILSLLFSIRQKVDIEAIAPYLIISLVLSARLFSSSYRVRLKEFRKKYKFVFLLSLIILLFNSFVVLFNKELYLFLDNPKKHFAYKFHIAKELAQQLDAKGIKCVDTNIYMQQRLKYYNIGRCKEYPLFESKKGNIKIYQGDRLIYEVKVTKINKE